MSVDQPTPAWIVGTDYSTDSKLGGVTLPSGVTFDFIGLAVTNFLFEMTGGRFPGSRTDTVRPHRTVRRSNFIGYASGYDWGGVGTGGWLDRAFPEGFTGYVNPSEFQLPMGPVSSVGQVTVDGVALAGKGVGWDLYDGRRLVRLADPVSGAMLPWPWDQTLAVPASQPGTWSVTYTHGQAPPPLGFLAARAMAIEFSLAVCGHENQLPEKTSRVARQDVTVDITHAFSSLEKGLTGIDVVDHFIAAYPKRRRAGIFSPDLPLSSIS